MPKTIHKATHKLNYKENRRLDSQAVQYRTIEDHGRDFLKLPEPFILRRELLPEVGIIPRETQMGAFSKEVSTNSVRMARLNTYADGTPKTGIASDLAFNNLMGNPISQPLDNLVELTREQGRETEALLRGILTAVAPAVGAGPVGGGAVPIPVLSRSSSVSKSGLDEQKEPPSELTSRRQSVTEPPSGMAKPPIPVVTKPDVSSFDEMIAKLDQPNPQDDEKLVEFVQEQFSSLGYSVDIVRKGLEDEAVRMTVKDELQKIKEGKVIDEKLLEKALDPAKTSIQTTSSLNVLMEIYAENPSKLESYSKPTDKKRLERAVNWFTDIDNYRGLAQKDITEAFRMFGEKFSKPPTEGSKVLTHYKRFELIRNLYLYQSKNVPSQENLNRIRDMSDRQIDEELKKLKSKKPKDPKLETTSTSKQSTPKAK